MAELQTLARSGGLSTRVEAYLASCIHMSLNRLMAGGTRELESTLYDLLVLYYNAEAARNRRSNLSGSIAQKAQSVLCD